MVRQMSLAGGTLVGAQEAALEEGYGEGCASFNGLTPTQESLRSIIRLYPHGLSLSYPCQPSILIVFPAWTDVLKHEGQTSCECFDGDWGQIFIFDFTFSLFQEQPHRSSPPVSYVKNKELTVCRVKRMTCRLKSDRGSSAVRPRSLREV